MIALLEYKERCFSMALETVLLEDYTKELVVPDCSDVGSYGVIGRDLGSL